MYATPTVHIVQIYRHLLCGTRLRTAVVWVRKLKAKAMAQTLTLRKLPDSPPPHQM
ncbi:hypothetical protein H6G89_16105 [Oscillatoria sp. FACHB-1407]|uniref:hypothetical protein n=1 Tax=Oscillatoria sp. FACHB-1407 TaxID=2692847 RepID=UPI001686A048|nr:hypothetical protein [Oscillatoria sp. FACHB-1407]MBD2462569.1 hypothetical protein [Oscillatoria sp. FACHB-1407]